MTTRAKCAPADTPAFSVGTARATIESRSRNFARGIRGGIEPRVESSFIAGPKPDAEAMQSRVAEFRARAQQCESAARRAMTLTTKGHLLELARGWRDMADHLERRARITTLAQPDAVKTGPGSDPRPSAAPPRRAAAEERPSRATVAVATSAETRRNTRPWIYS
jgi:hypothetical protein